MFVLEKKNIDEWNNLSTKTLMSLYTQIKRYNNNEDVKI